MKLSKNKYIKRFQYFINKISHLKRPYWKCYYCGWKVKKEEEVVCWKCGKGDMVFTPLHQSRGSQGFFINIIDKIAMRLFRKSVNRFVTEVILAAYGENVIRSKALHTLSAYFDSTNKGAMVNKSEIRRDMRRDMHY